MKKLKSEKVKKLARVAVMVAVAACALGGCKSVKVKTADWEASYTCFGQQNDVKGLEVSAGKDVALKVGETKSSLDPAVQDALRSAAAALQAACSACEAVAK